MAPGIARASPSAPPQDKTVSVSDANGTHLHQLQCKQDPLSVAFATQKGSTAARAREEILCIDSGNQTLLLHTMDDTVVPVELAFQGKYGQVRNFQWFGDGYVAVNFANGYIVCISSHMKEINEEIRSFRLHPKRCSGMACAPSLQQLASIGEDGLRVVSTVTWKEVRRSPSVSFPHLRVRPSRTPWTGTSPR